MERDLVKLMPSLVLVFSGKRKSGKDYVTEKLSVRLYFVANDYDLICPIDAILI